MVYQSGFTGKAATWAKKKKKQHHEVLEGATVVMENVNMNA